jgi:fibronectin-binding autotransporter adhesin
MKSVQKRTVRVRGSVLVAAAVAVTAAGASGARAANVTWDNDSTNFLWGTASNWSANALPLSTDTAVFSDAAAGAIDLGALNRTVDTLRFTDTIDTGYALNTGLLTLNLIDQAGTGQANNQINSSIAAAGSSLQLSVTSGMLDISGQITTTQLLVSPLVAGDGVVALRNAGNAISGSTTVSNFGAVLAIEPGSLGSTPINLSGGKLSLLSDTPGGIYGNNVTVTGAGNTITADAYAGGVLDNTLHLGVLNIGANSLAFQSRSGYRAAFNSTVITGNATFNGFSEFNSDPPSKLALGAVSQVGASSITLNGTGQLILDGVGTYTGLTTINGGMLTASVNGALGSGNVEVYSDGTINLGVAQSPFRPIIAGKNGEKFAAVAGNLTGAIYSGGSKNVTLATDSILAITTGPSPVRGVDVSGAAYYRGLTSNSQVITVGDDGSTSIYKGAAFGPYTPTAATPISFSGTISGIDSNGLLIYMGTGTKDFNGATFNSVNPSGVHFSGPGAVNFSSAPAGTATAFSHVGTATTASQSTLLFNVQGHHIFTTGKVINVSDGIYFQDSNDSIRDAVGAGGATVNIGSGGSAYLFGMFPNAGPTAGTFNISSGGALYIASSVTKPNAGATWNFSPGSLLVLGTGINTGSASTWIPSVSDIVIDNTSPVAMTGQGVVIGNGRRLTTAANHNATLTGGIGIKAAGGATGVVLTASGASSTLDVNDNLLLSGVDLQIGDTSNFTSTNFTTRVSASQAGTVRIDGASGTVGNLTIKAGNLNVGDQNTDVLTAASITHNSTGTTTLENGIVNLTNNLAISAGAVSVASKINYGAASAVNVTGGALSFNMTAAPTLPAPLTMNVSNGASLTAAGWLDPVPHATTPTPQ